ncbi:hypothetical protein MBLNU230_g3707t1 [Neophaeotheca triangularis]
MAFDSGNHLWSDMDRKLGQLFMMGFQGNSVTPQIRKLIQEHHIGSILLSAKNMKSAEETTQLVYDLQKTAYDAGHPVPLAISIDQENGGVNSLFDDFIGQYPSAMGLAATGSLELTHEVSKATGEEVSACGINLMMGPCLDVLTANARSQPLGVRTAGDDPKEVSSYGVASMKGYHKAGVAAMGKHFPSYGSLGFLGCSLDVPTITDSLEQLKLNALVPFRNAIKEGLDAVLVGGCAMSSTGLNVMHACLSEQVVHDLLRNDLKFKGVVVSDCLEMEALSHNIGVGGGTVMAINAGCDIVLLCRSFAHQQEAIEGLKLGLENGIITSQRVEQSLERVLAMKSKRTDWEKALHLPKGGTRLLSQLQPSHRRLSSKAYDSSITVVRDKNRLLPLSNVIQQQDELLLLTPLVNPLVASTASAQLPSDPPDGNSSLMSGERVFRELGRSLARQRGRVLHTSYTATGIRPQHENLINRAKAVVVVTADSNRNLYQNGFTKHVSMICNNTAGGQKREKPLVVISVSSPYDFALDQSTIGTYVCTYDFTEAALASLVKVLYGEVTPIGTLPGTMRSLSLSQGRRKSQSRKPSTSRQHWLVEPYNEDRDSRGLDMLIQTVISTRGQFGLSGATSHSFLLKNPNVLESHFVVRNSTTQAVYGFCSTYFFTSSNDGGTGVIGAIFVDPGRRRLSIGHSLHARAIRALLQRENIQHLQLGSKLPGIFPGLPTNNEREQLQSWFANRGWTTAKPRPVCSMLAPGLSTWTPPEGTVSSLQGLKVAFDLVYGPDDAGKLLEHIEASKRPDLVELYKLVLADPTSGIIRAKRPTDAAIVGTVVLFHPRSTLAGFVPSMKEAGGEVVGGISAPVISPSVEHYSALLRGLVLMSMRQLKQQGYSACLLDQIDSNSNESLSAMGCNVLHRFEELSCDAATWPRP